MTNQQTPAPVCFIAGGAAGIGAEISRLMAEFGCRVAIFDINSSDGEKLAAELGGRFYRTDVRDEESFTQAIDECVEEIGVPNYVSLNFGVMTVPGDSDTPYLPLESVTTEAYRRVMSINVDGVFFGLRHLIPLMRDTGGAITITASRAALVPTAADTIYAASKAAILHMARSAAVGQRNGKLRINALCPGTVDTNMLATVVREAGIPLISAKDMAAEAVSLLKDGRNAEVRGRIHGRDAILIGTFNSDLDYQPVEPEQPA